MTDASFADELRKLSAAANVDKPSARMTAAEVESVVKLAKQRALAAAKRGSNSCVVYLDDFERLATKDKEMQLERTADSRVVKALQACGLSVHFDLQLMCDDSCVLSHTYRKHYGYRLYWC